MPSRHDCYEKPRYGTDRKRRTVRRPDLHQGQHRRRRPADQPRQRGVRRPSCQARRRLRRAVHEHRADVARQVAAAGVRLQREHRVHDRSPGAQSLAHRLLGRRVVGRVGGARCVRRRADRPRQRRRRVDPDPRGLRRPRRAQADPRPARRRRASRSPADQHDLRGRAHAHRPRHGRIRRGAPRITGAIPSSRRSVSSRDPPDGGCGSGSSSTRSPGRPMPRRAPPSSRQRRRSRRPGTWSNRSSSR